MATTSQGRDGTWEGGSLNELLSFLAEHSLSARVEAFGDASADGAGKPVGHIDVVAGGVSDAAEGKPGEGKQGDDAVALLSKRPDTHFRVELRLPSPAGTLDPAGEKEGSLATRSVAAIMRYCEEFVLSCALVLERKGEVARIVYRRGEITATMVDGADAPDRLPDVMGWSDGSFHIDVVAPEMPRRPPAATPAAAKKPGGDVSTLFGYPVPGPKPAPSPAEPRAPLTVAGPRIAERPTPKVPMSVVSPDPLSSRPTPRAPTAAVPAAPAKKATPTGPAPTAPIQLTTVASGKSRPAPDPATIPGPIPDQLTHARFPHPAELRIPENGFLAQPLIVHVFVGVALGLLAVAAYWAYLGSGGAPLQLG
jgi:hypothetical protein